jgi:CHAD domain-containing protein
MSYELKDPRIVEDEIKRVADEQIETILEALTTTNPDQQDKDIHTARKSLKKLRALLRLVQEKIGQEQYQQENACFRDAGRFLSEMRDAQVRLETLDHLATHFAQQLGQEQSFLQVREVLTTDYQAAQQQVLQEDDAIINAVALVMAAQQRVQDWPLKASDWSVIRTGIRQIYRQGSQQLTKAFEKPSVERLHNWRKRVKDLWYHLCLLKPLWPDVMKELAHQLKVLGECLGDDHDLAVLRQTLLEQPERFDDQDLEMLVALIDRRREELQLTAQRLGERLYAEKPSAFVNRLEAYWQVWQAETAQPISVEV